MLRATIPIAFLLSAIVSTGAQSQWIDENIHMTTTLDKLANPAAPKVSCANFATVKVISCVFPNRDPSTNTMNLFETQSSNGGITWSNPVSITNDAGDEYDPMIEYDSKSDRLNLVYAKWHNGIGGNHNDVIYRSKSTYNGSWSSAKVIAGDGVNDYWIPSILTLKNGNINVFYTVNGPESSFGRGSGRIAVARSSDDGTNFTPTMVITNTCDAEYPRAIQNSYGDILLTFSRYIISKDGTSNPCADGKNAGEYPHTNIHQIWSSNDGITWTGESTLYHNPTGSAMHPYVAAETTNRQNPYRYTQVPLRYPSHSVAIFNQDTNELG